MIELLYGLPGDGKTYSAVRLIVDSLWRTKSYVCHNVPLAPIGAIAEYLESKGREVSDVASRLRLLTDDEVGRFWRCLGPGWDVPGGTDGDGLALPGSKKVDLGNGRTLTVPDYDRVPNDFPGVVYVLDEAHIHFSAYRWTEMSEEATWAVSQHRHLGMEIVLVSQHPEKIAKALRRDIHRFTRVKNFGNRRTLGFVAKGRFRRITYPELPVRGAEVMVEESSWFRFDPELGKLYSTNAGVGITGKVFNVERKPKGLPLKALFVIVPIVLAAIWMLPYAGAKLLGKGLVAFVGGGSKVVKGTVGKMVGNTATATGAVSKAVSGPVSDGGAVQKDVSELHVVSYAYCGLVPESCSWVLSDGSVVTRSTPGFKTGGPGWCNVKGQVYDYSAKFDHDQHGDSGRRSPGRGGIAAGGSRSLSLY